MKVIELFAGIGGFRYGLERVQFEDKNICQSTTEVGDKARQSIKLNNGGSERLFNCVWANEIDKYACQIYKKNFGGGELYEGDITKIKTDNIPNHDLLTAGFPCQAFSIAGKRGGFKDTRGTMFFEIARILQQKQPRLLLLENVKGLLSHDQGKTFGVILNTLDELGYDCQWQVLNSKNFGVPQNRERVFIIGHLRGTSRPQVFPIGETTTGSIKVCARGKHQQDIVYNKSGILNLPAGTHGSTPHLTKVAYAIDSNYWKGTTYEQFQKKKRRQLAIQNMKIRRLTPIECERLQGFPDKWTQKGIDINGNEINISDTQRYKCLGNAVTTNVITEIGKRLIK